MTVFNRMNLMHIYNYLIERCPATGLYVGMVSGFPGMHSQGETLDELHKNMYEVIEMLSADETLKPEAEFIGMQQIVIA